MMSIITSKIIMKNKLHKKKKSKPITLSFSVCYKICIILYILNAHEMVWDYYWLRVPIVFITIIVIIVKRWLADELPIVRIPMWNEDFIYLFINRNVQLQMEHEELFNYLVIIIIKPFSYIFCL